MAKLLLGNSLKHLTDRIPGLQRVLWALEGLVIGAGMGISALLPVDLASNTGRRLLRAIGPRLDKTRKFRRNLSLAFPDKSAAEIEALIRENWGNVGAVLAEFPHLPAMVHDPSADRIDIVIQADSEVFKNTGKPAVFVAAHLSNWEITAVAIRRLGIPVSGIYTPQQNPWLDRMLLRVRKDIGCGLIPREGGIRALVQVLNKGDSIGLLVDQRVDSGEPLPFFGIDMSTSVTPARLALRYDCDLIPMRVERRDGARFRVTFHAPLTPPGDALDDHQKALGMTLKINALFESWITAQPTEWLCTKRRWPKDARAPAGKRRASEPGKRQPV